jgi:hypothetical protein
MRHDIVSLSPWERVGVRASQFCAIVLLATACSPPQKCVQSLVSETGTVISPPILNPPLGVVGEPFELAVFAPRTACLRDAPTVSVELLGPDNYEVSDVTVTNPLVNPGEFAVVSAQVSFTPARAGQHLLRAWFEPSLGSRSVIIDVAESRIAPPSTRVHVPRSTECVNEPWPVNADVVACERNTGQVELFAADGGASSFAGEQLVVAGPVLWSVESATNELHRHVIQDGGLVLTDAFQGFSARVVKGEHDERRALRSLTSGELVVARIEDSLYRLGYQWNDVPSERVLFVDNGWLEQETPCSFTGCASLRGLEPGMRWTNDRVLAAIAGHKRPLDHEQMTADVVMQFNTALLPSPEGGFERLPLWLQLSQTSSVSVLVNSDRPQLGLTAWKRSEVLRVGKSFVVLSDPSGGDDLRITPR